MWQKQTSGILAGKEPKLPLLEEPNGKHMLIVGSQGERKSFSDWHQGGNRALNFVKSVNCRLIFAPKISLIVKVSWAFHITNRHRSGLNSPGSCCLDIPTYLLQGNRAICISHLFDAWDIESIIKKILFHFIWKKWKGKLFKRYSSDL